MNSLVSYASSEEEEEGEATQTESFQQVQIEPAIHTTSAPVGPSRPDVEEHSLDLERQRVQELTMPTIPNFAIPNSPEPEESTKSAITAKFERFLALKKQNVHFNERLKNSPALGNPSLLPKLMEFAGITQNESYASALPEHLAVRTEWPEECYLEGLQMHLKSLPRKEEIEYLPATADMDEKSGNVEHLVTRLPAWGKGQPSAR